MTIETVTSQMPKHLHKSINVGLTVATCILGVITFFAIQDILVAITAFVVAQTSAESWVTVRDTYVVITVRNIWVFIGGVLLLVLFIVGIDYHARHLGDAKSTKILVWTLLAELFFIGVGALV